MENNAPISLRPTPRDLRLAAGGAIALAALSVGLAIHVQDGEYTRGALLLVTLALIATGWAIIGPRPSIRSERRLTQVLQAAIAIELLALFTSWPGVDLPHGGRWQLAPFFAGLLASVVLLAFVARNATFAWYPMLVAAYLFLAFWMVRSSPNPRIDVWVFQQDAAAELL